MKKYYLNNKNKCINCNKLITNMAIRCHSCANINAYKKGLKNNKGKNNPNFGNHKIAGKNNPMFGKNHSPETIEKMRINKLNKYEKEDNPNWKGGIGRLPYNHNFYKLRHVIWDRDNYICQKCGVKIDTCLLEFKALLTVHHIDYNKLNDVLINLITLCRKCNSEVNANRDYWNAYFMYLMENSIYV